MLLKNETDGYVGFAVRMNPNETVRVGEGDNASTKPAPPKLRTIRIPPLATVEIEDAVWEKAWAQQSERQGITTEQQDVAFGASDTSTVKREQMTVVNGDGNWTPFYPVRDMVKNGIISIAKHATLEAMTVAQMREAIEKEQGYPLPKDVDAELVEAQYRRMFG